MCGLSFMTSFHCAQVSSAGKPQRLTQWTVLGVRDVKSARLKIRTERGVLCRKLNPLLGQRLFHTNKVGCNSLLLPPMPTLSIVIPAYNEGPTIHLILDKVLNVQLPKGWTKEVIIVNDCSKDDTEVAIQTWADGHPALPIRYHAHAVNQGKGAALHKPASPRPRATTSSFRTPTWSTIPRSTIYCCNPY